MNDSIALHVPHTPLVLSLSLTPYDSPPEWSLGIVRGMSRLHVEPDRSLLPSFQRCADTLFQYLRDGGTLSQKEATLLEAYARRLASLVANRSPEVDASTLQLVCSPTPRQKKR